jgi:hypothetical protein
MPGGVGGARVSLASTRFGRGSEETERLPPPRLWPTSADPTGEKARAVKARYVGVCRGCGAYTQPRNGKGDAYAYCKRCHPGAIERRWTRELVVSAMLAWRERYGRWPSSYDWSRTHARRRGEQALRRLAGGMRKPRRSNLGLGHDIRAALIQPSEAQLRAVREIVCRLLVRHYGELIAYGAGWTDPERQQPVGDTGRHEPRHPDAIVAAELESALEDPDPLRGITQLTARLGAAVTLNPAGVTHTKTLGTDRMARKLRDALPGGENALRASVWELMRPMLSPALVALNRDGFVTHDECETTVDLAGRHATSSLDDLGLDELNDAAV